MVSCGFVRTGSSDFSAFAVLTASGAPAPCPSPPSCVPPMSAIKASDFFDADLSPPSALAAPSAGFVSTGLATSSEEGFAESLAVRPRLASVDGLLLSEARRAVDWDGLLDLSDSFGLNEELLACVPPLTRRGLLGDAEAVALLPIGLAGLAGDAGEVGLAAGLFATAVAAVAGGGAAAFFGDLPGPGDRAFRMEAPLGDSTEQLS